MDQRLFFWLEDSISLCGLGFEGKSCILEDFHTLTSETMAVQHTLAYAYRRQSRLEHEYYRPYPIEATLDKLSL